jgi:hypothetical protein
MPAREQFVSCAIQEDRALLVTLRHPNCNARFIDLSHPENPTILTTMTSDIADAVAFAGSRIVALFRDARGKMRLSVNANNPNNPATLSSISLDGPRSIRVDGDTVCVVSRPSRLTVYDISDPANLRQRMQFDISVPTDYLIRGNRLALTISNTYAGRQGPGLYLYDLDRSREPIGFLSLPGAKSVDIQGDLAYVGTTIGDGSTGLNVVDIHDLARPQLLGQTLHGPTERVVVSGDTVFLLGNIAQANLPGARPMTLLAADVSNPERPILLGQSPGRATLGYMKRRARRLLRALAKQNPAGYIELATHVLLESGRGRKELDVRQQWISMDLLYGGATHWEQVGHGRGAYLLRPGGLRLRAREERGSDLWDQFPEQATTLASTAGLPWQTQEAAVKMLRGMRPPLLPDLPVPLLTGYLRSPSPLLITLATRALAAQIRAGEPAAAELAADSFFLGSGRTRNAVRDLLVRQEADTNWSATFAERLLQLAREGIGTQPLTRRQNHAFACLVLRFPTQIDRLITPQIATALYAARLPELAAWTRANMERADANDIDLWLQALESLPADLRAEAIEHLRQAVRTQRFGGSLLTGLALNASAWIRAVGWELIAASATDPANITRLWNQLLEAKEETDALRSAIASPAALALLERIAFSREKIEALLPTRPFLIGLLPPSALRAMLDVLPMSALPALIQAATEAQWPALRIALIAALRDPAHLNAFWQAVWPHLGSGDAPLLTARLLNDSDMTETFNRVTDVVSLLTTSNPVYGPLLGRWVRAHGEQYRRDTSELLQIATHMLPDIRAYGLERVRALGMGLPFALRLMESELPAAVALGHEYVTSSYGSEGDELDVILALCDSPRASVRAYGRETLEARWTALPQDLLLNRLAESPDPAMQAYLAGKMLRGAEPFAQAATFDRQVLRGRDRARRAKELVKQRLDREPSHDIPLLMEMARGRSARDAEWALGQLARLALEGAEIPGFAVQGGTE